MFVIPPANLHSRSPIPNPEIINCPGKARRKRISFAGPAMCLKRCPFEPPDRLPFAFSILLKASKLPAWYDCCFQHGMDGHQTPVISHFVSEDPRIFSSAHWMFNFLRQSGVDNALVLLVGPGTSMPRHRPNCNFPWFCQAVAVRF